MFKYSKFSGALFSQVKPSTAKPASPSIVKENDEEAQQAAPTSVTAAQTEAEQHLLLSEQHGDSPAPPTDVPSAAENGEVTETPAQTSSLARKKIM